MVIYVVISDQLMPKTITKARNQPKPVAVNRRQLYTGGRGQRAEAPPQKEKKPEEVKEKKEERSHKPIPLNLLA